MTVSFTLCLPMFPVNIFLNEDKAESKHQNNPNHPIIYNLCYFSDVVISLIFYYRLNAPLMFPLVLIQETSVNGTRKNVPSDSTYESNLK